MSPIEFGFRGAMNLAVCLVSAALARALGDVAVCPGEGDRYRDHRCNHDPTHRVCAKLLDADGQPLSWGKGDFWEITGQKAFQWDEEIRENHGDSWCICMWATASLIEAAGCENVHLNCAATDVSYVSRRYTDGGVDLAAAKKCLQQKCGGGAEVSSDDGGLGVPAAALVGLVAAAAALAGLVGVANWRRASTVVSPPMVVDA